jgi:hypothetical protein
LEAAAHATARRVTLPAQPPKWLLCRVQKAKAARECGALWNGQECLHEGREVVGVGSGPACLRALHNLLRVTARVLNALEPSC